MIFRKLNLERSKRKRRFSNRKIDQIHHPLPLSFSIFNFSQINDQFLYSAQLDYVLKYNMQFD